MKCYVPTGGGRFCGQEATVFDGARGQFVCGAHSALAISATEFTRRLEGCFNETEVKRLVLRHQESIMGTRAEIDAALNLAFWMEWHFSGGAEGVPGLAAA